MSIQTNVLFEVLNICLLSQSHIYKTWHLFWYTNSFRTARNMWWLWANMSCLQLYIFWVIYLKVTQSTYQEFTPKISRDFKSWQSLFLPQQTIFLITLTLQTNILPHINRYVTSNSSFPSFVFFDHHHDPSSINLIFLKIVPQKKGS